MLKRFFKIPLVQYASFVTGIFLLGWGANTTYSAVTNSIVTKTRNAVIEVIKPLKDTVHLLYDEQMNSKKVDTLIYNSFNRYKLSRAKSDKEIIRIMKEVQNQMPLFLFEKKNLIQYQVLDTTLFRVNTNLAQMP
jgi:hypothetical protein